MDDPIDSVVQFKELMWQTQRIRKRLVAAILMGGPIDQKLVTSLNVALQLLANDDDQDGQQHWTSVKKMHTPHGSFYVDVRDELSGLKKDMKYLHSGMTKADLTSILAQFHLEGEPKFREEVECCKRFLLPFIEDGSGTGHKPALITDWDGTMKDYCSQYATNVQPAYSAVGLSLFARRFTRLSIVLTAGPLRGPGILDLTSVPLDGPLLFSGSWGREWWLAGRRIVDDDGISEEAVDALNRFNDELVLLLENPDYQRFTLVGSGVQRKVDRLTLGVQTVTGQVSLALSEQYQSDVRERIHRVDPSQMQLNLLADSNTCLEMEVAIQTDDGTVWNKADGVDRVFSSLRDSLDSPGRVLVCGDTASDLPMVSRTAQLNPQGVMALFVGVDNGLRERVVALVADQSRHCFVSCPDVIHAAISEILR